MTIFEQLERAQAGLIYLMDILQSGTLAEWERKEYTTQANDKKNEIATLESAIKEAKEYGITS